MIYIHKDAEIDVSMSVCDAQIRAYMYSITVEDDYILDSTVILQFYACDDCGSVKATIFVRGDHCDKFIGDFDFLVDVHVKDIRGFEECTTINECVRALAQMDLGEEKRAA